MAVIRRIWLPTLTFLLLAVAASQQDDLLGRLGNVALNQTQHVIASGLQIAIFTSAAYLANRLLEVFVWDGIFQRRVGLPVPRLVRDLVGTFTYLIALTSILAVVFRQPVAGIWTATGAFSVVIGLALRDIILDLFVGLAINFERPFKMGDFVMLQQGNMVGRVTQINWRTTRLETNENNVVIVPNRRMGEMVLVNLTQPSTHAEFELLFSLDYAVPTERALRVLGAGALAVAGMDGVLADPEPKVRVKGVSPLGVDYKVKYWVDCAKAGPGKARHRVMVSVLEHLRHAGLTLAYQKQDLFLARMPQRQLDAADLKDRVKLLSRVDLFAALPEEEMERLAADMTPAVLKQGATVITQGEDGDSMFIVLEGLLRAAITFPGEVQPTVVGQIHAGGFFGEMSLLTGEPRTATITAATETLLYEITKPQLEVLFGRHPDVAEEISRVIAERRLRNDTAYVNATRAEQDAQRASLANQILGEIRGFFHDVFAEMSLLAGAAAQAARSSYRAS